MKIFGPEDPRVVQQLDGCVKASGEVNVPTVLCADNHPGYSMPIGGVIALKDHVIPAGVGVDIGCGNAAVRTNVQAKDVDVKRIMDEIFKVISFGMGRPNGEEIPDHPIFDMIAHSPVVEQRGLLQLARQQLGTVGGGNHYIDLFEDRADGQLWIGNHFGSRGFGFKTGKGFEAIAEGSTFDVHVKERDMDAEPAVLDMRMPSGQAYIEAMKIAGEYAGAGRIWVIERILQMLGAHATYLVHNHHNFAWREVHNGETFWVIRKGATPARPGQTGFIGGTMRDDAVIIEGVESPESRLALYSTVHGAGRAMGRRVAAGKTRTESRWKCLNYRKCDFSAPKGGFHKDEGGPTPKCPKCGHKLKLERMTRIIKPGLVDWPAAKAEMHALNIELRGAAADEAAQCYKKLPEVLAHHAGTIKILHTLRPIGVAMAGEDTFDPFKD